MVGLLVVGSGVLVRRVVRACDPTAGQAQPQRGPAFSAVPALLTSGRRRFGVDARGRMRARAWTSGIPSADIRSWHPGPPPAGSVAMWSLTANSPPAISRNGQ